MTSLATAREQESPSRLVMRARSEGPILQEGAVRVAMGRELEIVHQMVALQERIDFEVYRLFGFIGSASAVAAEIAPGARPFEVQLVRDATPTAWFIRHG
jgi:hypothetical protein